jgi:hypothetical protein
VTSGENASSRIGSGSGSGPDALEKRLSETGRVGHSLGKNRRFHVQHARGAGQGRAGDHRLPAYLPVCLLACLPACHPLPNHQRQAVWSSKSSSLRGVVGSPSRAWELAICSPAPKLRKLRDGLTGAATNLEGWQAEFSFTQRRSMGGWKALGVRPGPDVGWRWLLPSTTAQRKRQRLGALKREGAGLPIRIAAETKRPTIGQRWATTAPDVVLHNSRFPTACLPGPPSPGPPPHDWTAEPLCVGAICWNILLLRPWQGIFTPQPPLSS